MVQLVLEASKSMAVTTLTVASASWFMKMFRATSWVPTTMHPKVGLKSQLGIRRVVQSLRHLPMLFLQKLPLTQIATYPHRLMEGLHGVSTQSHSKVKTRMKSTHRMPVIPAMRATPQIAAMPVMPVIRATPQIAVMHRTQTIHGGSSDDGGCASTTQAPLWLLTALIACRRRQKTLSV